MPYQDRLKPYESGPRAPKTAVGQPLKLIYINDLLKFCSACAYVANVPASAHMGLLVLLQVTSAARWRIWHRLVGRIGGFITGVPVGAMYRSAEENSRVMAFGALLLPSKKAH